MRTLSSLLILVLLLFDAGQVVANDVSFAPLTCAYYEHLCKTEKEKAKSRANRKESEAAEEAHQAESARVRAHRASMVNVEIQRLGKHREREAANLVAMREAAERARPKRAELGREGGKDLNCKTEGICRATCIPGEVNVGACLSACSARSSCRVSNQ